MFKKSLFFLLLLVSCSVQSNEFKPHTMPNMRVIPLADKNTNKHYYLYVKLPDDYAESPEKRYTITGIKSIAWIASL